jgi:hypothetical protein
MTRQHLVGELSQILGELEIVVAANAAGDVHTLRQEAETSAPDALAPIAERALAVAERECWGALVHGEVATFVREAEIGAELWELGVCAHLLQEC